MFNFNIFTYLSSKFHRNNMSGFKNIGNVKCWHLHFHKCYGPQIWTTVNREELTHSRPMNHWLRFPTEIMGLSKTVITLFQQGLCSPNVDCGVKKRHQLKLMSHDMSTVGHNLTLFHKAKSNEKIWRKLNIDIRSLIDTLITNNDIYRDSLISSSD